MNTRTSYLDFRETGTDQTRAKVESLATSTEKYKKRMSELAPILMQTSTAGGVFERAAAAAQNRVVGLTGSLGPLGSGLGMVASRGALGAMGLTQWAAAAERASLMSRILNTTILTGVGTISAGAVAAAAHADDVIRAGDSYQALTSRIKANTEGLIAAAQAERQLYANAGLARMRVDDQLRLFTRTAPAVQESGRGSQDALRLTDLVGKGIAIGGASSVEQSTAMQQLAQGLGSGVLQGDELRTLREAAPQLLRYLAQNLELNGKIGVSFGQLKKLGAENKLTTDKVIEALLRAGPMIERDFVNAPKAAQAQWDVMKDKISRAVGALAVTSGAQANLVEWLADLGEKADAFREKMMLDGSAVASVKAATDFIGDAVGGIAQFGALAADNFDLIVTAGQLVIALKLGDVFAGWFRSAATGAQAALSNLQAFQAAARQQAALTGTSVQQEAARGLTSSAEALRLRATELQAKADVQAAQAAAAKAAADRAAGQAADMKAMHGAKAAATVEAEAIANQQAALATKLKDQADRAATAAAGAKTAASARAAVALEAEAAVTQRVTGATLAKNAASRAALGLYSLLGGAWGIAALAIGALAFAVWKAEEAHRAEMVALREKIIYGERLEALTNSLAAATWAEIPAIQAKINALYAEAEAARQAAEDNIKLANARAQAAQRQANITGDDGDAFAAAFFGGRARKVIADNQAVLDAARRAQWSQSVQRATATITDQGRKATQYQQDLATGKDPTGQPLSAAGRAEREAALKRYAEVYRPRLEALSQQEAAQQAAVDKATGAERERLLRGQALIRGQIYAVNDVLRATAPPTAGAPPVQGGGGKGRKTAVPGPVNTALQELTRQEYRPKEGLDRFTLAGGSIVDTTTGATFKARSEDEAKAAAEYVKQIEAINAAKDAEIAKTGESREALRQAASAKLDYAVKTSQASQADERWAELQAEMTGATRAEIKAKREVNDLKEKGAALTDDEAKAYVAFVIARENAKKAAEALSFAAPLARDAADTVLAGSIVPTDARGVADVEAATRQLMEAKARIVLETERRIREEVAILAKNEAWDKERTQRELSQRLGAAQLAVEAETLDRLAALRRQATEDSARYIEDRYAETADSLISSLKDVIAGGEPGEIGAALANDLLQAVYDELIYSPLRQAIIGLLRDMMSASTTGAQGGGWGALLGKFIVSAFGGSVSAGVGGHGGGAAGAGSAGVQIPRNADGGLPAGLLRGSGGPREDKNLAYFSPGEFLVNEKATRRHLGLLHAINSGAIPAFADGGRIGGGRIRDIERLIASEYGMPGGVGGVALAPMVIVAPSMAPAPLSGGGGGITIHNYGSSQVETSQEAGGGTRIDVYDTVGRDAVKSAGATGDLQRAARKGPRITRRG